MAVRVNGADAVTADELMLDSHLRRSAGESDALGILTVSSVLLFQVLLCVVFVSCLGCNVTR